jgi:hypothetical protein
VIRYRNDTSAPVHLDLFAHATFQVATPDNLFLGFWDGPHDGYESKCGDAPIGAVFAPSDGANVTLSPGGTLTETIVWHAGMPWREMNTCGWNYRKIKPGHYAIRLEEPMQSPWIPIEVVARGECRPHCARGPGKLELTFKTYPKLADVGEIVRVRAPGYRDPVCGNDSIVVAHVFDRFLAYSGSCTDACCPVAFEWYDLQCPFCARTLPLRKRLGERQLQYYPHATAIYALDGSVSEPPDSSIASLPELEVCADECGAVVGLP